MIPLLFALFSISLCQAQPSANSICFEEPDTGSCRAFLPSFYFNAQTGSCDCFVYGGCAPGGNNFETLEMCMTTCGKNQATQVMSRECRRILSNVNVARPIGSSQNGVVAPGSPSVGNRPLLPSTDLSQSSGASSQSQGSSQQPSNGGSSVSVSNKHHDFNETTVQQLQTIFNEISAPARPSSTQEAINHPQDQQQRQPSQQRVPGASGASTRPVFPPSSPGLPPPVRQTTQDEKDLILSKTQGDRRRPQTSPSAEHALQRQIEQQKELERQLQQTIQQHQKLQQQQQQQQQEQLLQQQVLQREQQQSGRRKQQRTSG